MSAIDLVLDPAGVDASDWGAEAFEAALLRASRVFEAKAALLDCLAPPSAEARRPGVAAGRVVSHDPKLDEEPPVYGPAARRRLDEAWAAKSADVNDYLHALTGYDLGELSTCAAIEACMKLAANEAGEHPSLYPALMKLYRLQREEEV